jgi:hypothetical protein
MAFGMLGRDVPYHTWEDVESALEELGVAYQKQQVPYELTFPDTQENRMRIIRFLLADRLEQMPQQPLLELFDQYSRSGQINIRTASDHFTIRSNRKGILEFNQRGLAPQNPPPPERPPSSY